MRVQIMMEAMQVRFSLIGAIEQAVWLLLAAGGIYGTLTTHHNVAFNPKMRSIRSSVQLEASGGV